jgi:GAF domain-containing protein
MTDHAIAAGILAAGAGEQRLLLQSIVDVARQIFRARAASVFLHDAATDELVFEAVSGEGAGDLIGRRFPSTTGIAGWVLASRQPIVLEDVLRDPRFDRKVAEETGYVPKGLMAAPLLHGEESIGVLQVLDRPAQARFSLGEIELLGQFATQAGAALSVMIRARRVQALLEGEKVNDPAARLVAALDRLEGADRATGERLLDALCDVLALP